MGSELASSWLDGEGEARRCGRRGVSRESESAGGVEEVRFCCSITRRNRSAMFSSVSHDPGSWQLVEGGGRDEVR